MSITQSDRDIFIGAHLTHEQKELFRKEADRRGVSMSALVSYLIEEWLVIAPQEQVEKIRSNKRSRLNIIHETEEMIKKEKDVPLPFEVSK
jgi:hypothetical protein